VAAVGIGAILTWIVKKYSAREAVAHPLAFAACVGWSMVSNLFLTPLALCTMDSADWGTRTVVRRNPQTREVPIGNTTG
jgi:hypothetical protein